MDLHFLNTIPEDDLEELLNLGATLDLETGEEVDERLKNLTLEEKIWCSKIQLMMRNIGQRHLSDLKSYT